MMKRLLSILLILVILGTFTGTLVFLYRKSQADPVVFETEKPFVTDIVKKTVATGAIVPRREVEIKPRVSGILEEVAVEAGQHVKSGDLIARIKIVPNVVNLNSAEASVETARINFDNAARELERSKQLFQRSLVAEADLQRAEYEHRLRKQELDAARSNLQLIRSGASRKAGKVSNVVRSTVDGMVIEVPVEQGVSVTETNNFNAGTTIATVADMTDMIFEGRVDESEVGKIKEGMPLDIVVGAIEDKKLSGKLEYISPKGVDFEGAIQFEIRAALEAVNDVFIRANYSANANIVLDRRTQVIAIREALLQFGEDGKAYVEVEVGPQQFERREIETGLSDGVNIEIVKGLTVEDKVKRPANSGDAGPGGKPGKGKRKGGKGH